MSHLRRLRAEDGFTVAEMAVTAALSMLILTLLGGMLVVSYRTGVFTQGQSVSLDDARVALQQVQRDIQNAYLIDWAPSGCTTVGSCLEVYTQTPSAGTKWVLYEVSGSKLLRAEKVQQSDPYPTPVAVVERLANPAGTPLFACDTGSTLLRVNVDFVIQPTPSNSETYDLVTSVRPRNFASTAVCP